MTRLQFLISVQFCKVTGYYLLPFELSNYFTDFTGEMYYGK